MNTVYARLEGEDIVLAFRYDPLVIRDIHSIRNRRYDGEHKEWHIPYSLDAFGEVVEALRERRVIATPQLIERMEKDAASREVITNIRKEGDADLGDFQFVTEPWPHQRAAIGITDRLDGYALWWEMGTGKTKAAIDIARRRKARLVLVIAPNEVTYNWLREIKKHAEDITAEVLEGTLTQRTERLVFLKVAPPSHPHFVIINIEALAHLAPTIATLRWDMAIVDEATRFKNPQAKRTKALHSIRDSAALRLILTGTPVTHSLLDLWAPLEFIKPGLLGRFSFFRHRYFERMWNAEKMKVEEVPRVDTIEDLLRRISTITYRVTKKEVLPFLPDKLPPQYMEVVLAGDQRAAYWQMRRTFKASLMSMTDEEIKADASIIIVQMLRLSEITSGFLRADDGTTHWFPNHAKAAVVDDLVADLVDKQHKVVIFCNYRAECEFYEQRYKNLGSALIYGGMSPKDRDAIVNAFQTEASPMVLVCQEGSGGIGINLTAASTAIYTSRSFSLEQYLQSQDRLHRAGQKEEVNIVIIQARGTIDEEIDEVLAGKKSLADIVTRVREEKE